MLVSLRASGVQRRPAGRHVQILLEAIDRYMEKKRRKSASEEEIKTRQGEPNKEKKKNKKKNRNNKKKKEKKKKKEIRETQRDATPAKVR
ncbi:hypothetical protein EYF80_033195 [Liparis tanakae]|uniref:Uncharacterized protein n=1 Tax=Liparis tanakae TaxID=230148 RepID=A0A4Z2GSL4_9TELE|nr:hypothetical protein EYF80_033195 [Liparis tanakae]